ncbi:MAG: DUF6157 family protein [Chitinophagaceae bacterium]
MSSAIHTTNYYNTFIEVAEDCPVTVAEKPPAKEYGRTVASIQFDLISGHPYQFSSDDVVFSVFFEKNNLNEDKITSQREKFFSKGQPCLRSSPLTKRYGWGVHSNADGKIAIYDLASEEYKKYSTDKSLQHVKAMRSKRVS